LLQRICESPFVASDIQEQLREQLFSGFVKNNSFHYWENSIRFGTATKEHKEKLWAEITDPGNSDTAFDFEWKVKAFWQPGVHRDLIEPFFDRYYQVLPALVVHQPMTKANKFMTTCSPSLRGSDFDLQKVKELF